MTTPQAIRSRASDGFTLFEVLIALLVLSIGLLGLAGLQAIGMRNSHRAYLRTQAVMQAYDIVDRMRANLPGVTGGDYNSIALPVPAVPSCITTQSPCTPQDMATYDAYVWNTENQSLLPQGVGTVHLVPNPSYPQDPPQFQVTITWVDRVAALGTPTPVPSTLSITAQP